MKWSDLTTAQQGLVRQVAQAHENVFANGGIPTHQLADQRPLMDDLVIRGVLQWHPTSQSPLIAIPTPLGREFFHAAQARRAKRAQRRKAS